MGPSPKFEVQKNHIVTTLCDFRTRHRISPERNIASTNKNAIVSIYNVSSKRWPTLRDLWPRNGWDVFRHCNASFGGHWVATIIVATCLVVSVFTFNSFVITSYVVLNAPCTFIFDVCCHIISYHNHMIWLLSFSILDFIACIAYATSATDVTRSVVCVSVCWWHGCRPIVQRQLNRSRCCLGC